VAKISTGRAHQQFSKLIRRVAVGQERIVLSRRGRALAAIVPLDDLRVLQPLEDFCDLDEARVALPVAATGDTGSWEQIKADLGL
jgi:prevent-host-death family protein